MDMLDLLPQLNSGSHWLPSSLRQQKCMTRTSWHFAGFLFNWGFDAQQLKNHYSCGCKWLTGWLAGWDLDLAGAQAIYRITFITKRGKPQ